MNCVDNNTYEFEATITCSRFYNDDSCWGVYSFSTESDIPYLVQQTPDSLFDWFDDSKKLLKFGTLSGTMQRLNENAKYKIKATVSKNNKYGYQYNPISVSAIVPKTVDDQLLFLSSIVNKTVAEAIMEKYPNLINDLINGNITDIDWSDIKGVREKTWNKIKDKIYENYAMSDIITMLKPLGITFDTIKRLVKAEKNVTLLKQRLNENPYYLTKIHGFGFKRVDDFAIKLKPEIVHSVERLNAFIKWYFIYLGENTGDTVVTKNKLYNEVISNVRECTDLFDEYLDNNSLLHIHGDYIGLNSYSDIENYILYRINSIACSNSYFEIKDDVINEAIEDAEHEQGFKYTEEQLGVINKTLKSNVSIITGKAGCGKTSIMKAIMKAFQKSGIHFESCALSAMAANRISEASGFNSQTVHRLLQCKGENNFEVNEDYPLETDVVIIDECSMIGGFLFDKLISAIGNNTKVIMCGDHKQLPPIGYGNIFSDLINKTNCNHVHKLTKPMRQAEMSGILCDANIIRENENPIKEDIKPKLIHGELNDMYYMFRNDRNTLRNIAIKTYLNSIKSDGMDNVVIITPRKRNCINSSVEVNRIIQEHIMDKDAPKISNSENDFYRGSRVMQVVNDYENGVFNGDIGYVYEVSNIGLKVVFKNYEKPIFVEYDLNKLKELELAYATTCHKIQGAGIKTVIGIVDNTHYSLLDNCMLYTMLTRAKKRCLLLAEPSAFNMCIKNSKNDRKTWMSLK